VAITRRADLDFVEFEAMLTYDDGLTPRILDAAALELDRPRSEVMEDIGTYLVSNPNVESLRRLLRFGGVDFVDFLHSLDDLPDRARLAVPDLELPTIELRDHTKTQFSLHCEAKPDGFGHALIGILRGMADDYGALVLLDHQGGSQGQETIAITLVEAAFTPGRQFDLGARST
jgi:hypothetical protein